MVLDDDRYPAQNPYAAPEADLSEGEHAAAGALLDHPRTVAPIRGWHWCREGFRLFRAAPFVWFANVFLVVTAKLVIALVPVAGVVGTWLLQGLFDAGLMLGARDQARGRPLRVRHVGVGFERRVGPLIGVGVVHGGGLLASFLVAGVLLMPVLVFVGFPSDDSSAVPERTAEQVAMLSVLFGLLGIAILLPVTMACWFAPALIAFHNGVGLFDALRRSFLGCLRNLLPFLVWGGVLALLVGLISAPAALVAVLLLVGERSELLPWVTPLWGVPAGVLIGPLVYTSSYAAYRDVFLARRVEAE